MVQTKFSCCMMHTVQKPFTVEYMNQIAVQISETTALVTTVHLKRLKAEAHQAMINDTAADYLTTDILHNQGLVYKQESGIFTQTL